MNDYILAFDENDSPYIMHAFWNRNKDGQKKDHNYIQRVKGKNGLWRYFYDEVEWQAYLKGQTDKVNSIGGKIKDKLGYDEKKRMQDAKKNRNRAAENYREENLRKKNTDAVANNKRQKAATLALGKGILEQKKSESVRDYISKKKTINIIDKELNKVIPELEKVNKAAERRAKSLSDATESYIEAQTAYAAAISEYGKTPIGLIDTLLGKKPKWYN